MRAEAMALFQDLQIALDLGYSVSFKKKSELRKAIVNHGGIISYIVTKKSNFVVTSDPEKVDVSFKCRMAVKYGLPVVTTDYIWDSIQANKPLVKDSYVVGGKSRALDFKSGVISALKKDDKKKQRKKPRFNPGCVQSWANSDPKRPDFDEESCDIAKYAFYAEKCVQGKKEKVTYHVIELEAYPTSFTGSSNPENGTDQPPFKFRITEHFGSINDLKAWKGFQEHRYVKNADQALAVFAFVCDGLERKSSVEKVSPVRGIGSDKLQRIVAKVFQGDKSCSFQVKDIVEHVWQEAMMEISEVLTSLSDVKLQEVEKAEAVLVKVRDAIAKKEKEKAVSKLMADFYKCLPHKDGEEKIAIDARLKWLVRKQDMCQLIRDMLGVSELTNFSPRAPLEAKYSALKCHISHLEGSDRHQVEKLITQSLKRELPGLSILNVYELWRQEEDVSFRHDLEDKRLLFHCSRVENFVGILSRGLLLPKVVVDDYGGTRSDAGMLGNGIYFASDPSTSGKYSVASSTKGSRLLLVNEVALGQVKDFTRHDTSLTGPPEGFHSTHGVGKAQCPESQFEDDEFVVYSVNQQRLRYLVEFSVKDDVVTPLQLQEASVAPAISDGGSQPDISLDDVQSIADPLDKVKPGLISTGEDCVQLKGVHVRAQLYDLAAQVVVMQEYYNHSSKAIEAKYVFPLDSSACVCGFEAFINGKHIVGEVKEKEEAHREYKQAIKEGHGAYLMDQEETPDVFTVSVGNLPPGACVLIKITYVAELAMEEELINFCLPATVAPWKEDSALGQELQDDLESHKMSAQSTTVQVFVEMPFEIRSLECPSHRVRVKETSTMAVVEMYPGEQFGSGFQLLIGLAEIHVPRMWVEQWPGNSTHTACMLTFYPEFEASEVLEGEIILALDTSNSMKGKSLQEGKKVALLALSLIPDDWSFNVVTFGSEYKEAFPGPRLTTEENRMSATKFLQSCVADQGQTDIHQLLHSYHLLPKPDSQRNIFLVSDGHLNNSDLVMASSGLHSATTRVFTFGVSDTCNTYGLKALARVSGGAYEFFNPKTKSKWEPKVKAQVCKASQPGLTSVSVDWKQHDENLTLTQAPREITCLFNGSRQVIYGFVPNCTMAFLNAEVGGQQVSTVVSCSDLSITTGKLVHRLTARALINDWEDGMLSLDRTNHEIAKMDMKNFVIDVSKEYSIVTQFTSFIAVEKREENEKEFFNQGPSMSELVEKENVDRFGHMGWTRVMGEESLSALMERLRLEVESQCLSQDLSRRLGDLEEHCNSLDTNTSTGLNSLLQAAGTMAQALHLQGNTEKAKDLGVKMFKDNVVKIGTMTEKSAYTATRDHLDKLRQVLNSIQEDEIPAQYPLPAYDDGGRVEICSLTAGTSEPYLCSSTMTVLELKFAIEDKSGNCVDQQRLLYNGVALEDDMTLGQCDLWDGAKIILVLRLRGGGGDIVSRPAYALKPCVQIHDMDICADDEDLYEELSALVEDQTDEDDGEEEESSKDSFQGKRVASRSRSRDRSKRGKQSGSSSSDEMGMGLFEDSAGLSSSDEMMGMCLLGDSVALDRPGSSSSDSIEMFGLFGDSEPTIKDLVSKSSRTEPLMDKGSLIAEENVEKAIIPRMSMVEPDKQKSKRKKKAARVLSPLGQKLEQDIAERVQVAQQLEEIVVGQDLLMPEDLSFSSSMLLGPDLESSKANEIQPFLDCLPEHEIETDGLSSMTTLVPHPRKVHRFTPARFSSTERSQLSELECLNGTMGQRSQNTSLFGAPAPGFGFGSMGAEPGFGTSAANAAGFGSGTTAAEPGFGFGATANTAGFGSGTTAAAPGFGFGSMGAGPGFGTSAANAAGFGSGTTAAAPGFGFGATANTAGFGSGTTTDARFSSMPDEPRFGSAGTTTEKPLFGSPLQKLAANQEGLFGSARPSVPLLGFSQSGFSAHQQDPSSSLSPVPLCEEATVQSDLMAPQPSSSFSSSYVCNLNIQGSTQTAVSHDRKVFLPKSARTAAMPAPLTRITEPSEKTTLHDLELASLPMPLCASPPPPPPPPPPRPPPPVRSIAKSPLPPLPPPSHAPPPPPLPPRRSAAAAIPPPPVPSYAPLPLSSRPSAAAAIPPPVVPKGKAPELQMCQAPEKKSSAVIEMQRRIKGRRWATAPVPDGEMERGGAQGGRGGGGGGGGRADWKRCASRRLTSEVAVPQPLGRFQALDSALTTEKKAEFSGELMGSPVGAGDIQARPRSLVAQSLAKKIVRDSLSPVRLSCSHLAVRGCLEDDGWTAPPRCLEVDELTSPIPPRMKRTIPRKDEEDLSGSLAQFGIGVKVQTIRQPASKLLFKDLPAIFLLQNKMGHWQFSPELDRLMHIRSDKCIEILTNSGLQSFGNVAATNLQHLVCSLMVLLAVCELLLPELFPLDEEFSQLLASPRKTRVAELTTKAHQVLEKESGLNTTEMRDILLSMNSAQQFCSSINQQYPLAYSSLELGSDWAWVCAQFLGLVSTHGPQRPKKMKG